MHQSPWFWPAFIKEQWVRYYCWFALRRTLHLIVACTTDALLRVVTSSPYKIILITINRINYFQKTTRFILTIYGAI